MPGPNDPAPKKEFRDSQNNQNLTPNPFSLTVILWDYVMAHGSVVLRAHVFRC